MLQTFNATKHLDFGFQIEHIYLLLSFFVVVQCFQFGYFNTLTLLWLYSITNPFIKGTVHRTVSRSKKLHM